ncbi:MAG: hypothetical protein Q7N50_15810, partial [Armatimonadota bacterium]|nr:hypothetical protein [Armatimonadota bacterium]
MCHTQPPVPHSFISILAAEGILVKIPEVLTPQVWLFNLYSCRAGKLRILIDKIRLCYFCIVPLSGYKTNIKAV